MVKEPNRIAYCLEKAFHEATTGRPGPCWLDIPLDVQGATIETNKLVHFNPDTKEYDVSDDIVQTIIKKLSNAERAVIFAENGIRLAGHITNLMNLSIY